MRVPTRSASIFGARAFGAAVLVTVLAGTFGSVALSDPSPSPMPSKSAVVPVFVAPKGWHHAHGLSDGLGTWLQPGDADYAQNIVVEAKGGIASLDALFKAEVAYSSSLPDVFGYTPTNTTVCNKHPAKYLSYTYTSSTGLPVTTELVIAVFGTTGYSARYSKSISQSADIAAERSLTTLCGRTPSH